VLIAWKNDQKTEDLKQESKAVTSSWNDQTKFYCYYNEARFPARRKTISTSLNKKS